jgi:hypothetical protein
MRRAFNIAMRIVSSLIGIAMIGPYFLVKVSGKLPGPIDI